MSSKAYTYACMQDTGSAARQLTLYVIAEHINVENGKTYCSVRTLMREAHVKSDRTMRNYLADLEGVGFIKREKRQRVDGGNTTDNIELVGFLDWYASNGGPPVADPAAEFTGGSAGITGGPGSMATGHNDQSSNDKKDPPLPPKGGDPVKSRVDKKQKPAALARFVSEDALDRVRTIAPEWDRQALLAKFLAWPGSAQARNMDGAFLGWVKKFTKGKPPT